MNRQAHPGPTCPQRQMPAGPAAHPSGRLRICLVEDDNWLRAELEQAHRRMQDGMP